MKKHLVMVSGNADCCSMGIPHSSLGDDTVQINVSQGTKIMLCFQGKAPDSITATELIPSGEPGVDLDLKVVLFNRTQS